MARRTAEQERVWQEVRRVVIDRDEGVCRECGERVRPGEFDVHHMIPRAAGGRDEAGNCILLCDGCHAGHRVCPMFCVWSGVIDTTV